MVLRKLDLSEEAQGWFSWALAGALGRGLLVSCLATAYQEADFIMMDVRTASFCTLARARGDTIP
jgi:hypothetical protein